MSAWKRLAKSSGTAMFRAASSTSPSVGHECRNAAAAAPGPEGAGVGGGVLSFVPSFLCSFVPIEEVLGQVLGEVLGQVLGEVLGQVLREVLGQVLREVLRDLLAAFMRMLDVMFGFTSMKTLYAGLRASHSSPSKKYRSTAS